MSNFVEIDIDFDYCGEVDMVLAHDEGGEHEDVRYYRDRGGCHVEMVEDDFIPPDTRKYRCDGCDDTFLFMRGFHPCYCPNCGAKVVNA